MEKAIAEAKTPTAQSIFCVDNRKKGMVYDTDPMLRLFGIGKKKETKL